MQRSRPSLFTSGWWSDRRSSCPCTAWTDWRSGCWSDWWTAPSPWSHLLLLAEYTCILPIEKEVIPEKGGESCEFSTFFAGFTERQTPRPHLYRAARSRGVRPTCSVHAALHLYHRCAVSARRGSRARGRAPCRRVSARGVLPCRPQPCVPCLQSLWRMCCRHR